MPWKNIAEFGWYALVYFGAITLIEYQGAFFMNLFANVAGCTALIFLGMYIAQD